MKNVEGVEMCYTSYGMDTSFWKLSAVDSCGKIHFSFKLFIKTFVKLFGKFSSIFFFCSPKRYHWNTEIFLMVSLPFLLQVECYQPFHVKQLYPQMKSLPHVVFSLAISHANILQEKKLQQLCAVSFFSFIVKLNCRAKVLFKRKAKTNEMESVIKDWHEQTKAILCQAFTRSIQKVESFQQKNVIELKKGDDWKGNPKNKKIIFFEYFKTCEKYWHEKSWH